MTENEEEQNSLLTRVREKSQKAGLKLNIKKQNTLGGVLSVACQGFLFREACVGVLVGGAGFLLSGVQWSDP